MPRQPERAVPRAATANRYLNSAVVVTQPTGVYAEYSERLQSLDDLERERKAVLSRISGLRGGRDIAGFAADLSAPHAPIGIDYTGMAAV